MKSKAKLKAAVEVFYSQNHSKGKSYTWNQFKNASGGKKMCARIGYVYDCKNV